jgi:TPR repeat protein
MPHFLGQKLLLLGWIIFCASSTQAQSPFGGSFKGGSVFGASEDTRIALREDQRVELDISTPKKWGMYYEIAQRLADPEKISVFKEIYLEFIRSHSISEEGEFVSGGNTADTGAAIVYFQDYVNRNGMQAVKQRPRPCPVCNGAGKKFVPFNPDDAFDLRKVEVDCPNCPSDGRLPAQVTFVVTCRPVPAEALPEKPRITKQKALVARANSGDAPSLVEYATQLEKGVLGVDQDIPKAKEMFAKAAVLGNGLGIDGLIRILEQAKETDANARHLRYVLRLAQVALDKRPPYYIVTDELGVLPPAEMPYIEAKVAEVEARLLYFGFKERKLNPTDLSDAGLTRLLESLKKSLEKNPIATAIQKVEYVLVGMALSKGSEGFGSDKLKLAKEAAESDNPVAFGILGDVSERGLQSGKKNRQAAAILYGISKKNRPDKALEGRLQALESRHDRKVTFEMIGEYDKTKVGGRVNINFIEAVLKIEQTSEIK